MPAPRNRLASVVAGIAVLGFVATTPVVVSCSSNAVSGTAVRSPSEPRTDTEQIEATVAAFGKAWNDRDFTAMTPIVCTGTAASKEFTRSEFLEARDSSGPLTLVVESVDVDGDTANAEVSNDGENAQSIAMVREAGTWKWCEF